MKKILTLILVSFAFAPLTAFAQFTVRQGGTGSTTPSGILYGDNGTSLHLLSVTIGTNLSFSGGILSASGGSGTVGTSSAETANNIPWWTTTSAGLALLSGGSTSFQFNNSTVTLSATNASTTNVSASGTMYSTNASSTNSTTTSLYINGIRNKILSIDNTGQVVGSSTIGSNLLTTSGVSASSYTNANITVNAQGIITTASNGSGGAGTVSTSSSETANDIPFYTSTNGTPALLSGGDTAFQWNDPIVTLSAQNASTTNVSASGIVYTPKVTSANTLALNGTSFVTLTSGGQNLSWDGTEFFANHFLGDLATPWKTLFVTAASTTDVLSINATSTNATTTNQYITGIKNAVLGTDNNGQVVATGTIGYNLITGGPTGSNPSASIGLAVVNGSATTFMRSDAAPALSQSITPTWTGLHTFNTGGILDTASSTFNGGITVSNSTTTNATTTAFGFTGLNDAILSTNHTGQVVASTSIGANYLTGVLGVIHGGTGAATLTGCLTGNGTGAITGSGTCNTSSATVSSIVAGAGLTGGTITTSGTIAIDFTALNVWTGASTTFTGGVTIGTATTTSATTTNFGFTGIKDSLLYANHTGQVLASSTIGVNLLTGLLPIATGGTNNNSYVSTGVFSFQGGAFSTNSNFTFNNTSAVLSVTGASTTNASSLNTIYVGSTATSTFNGNGATSTISGTLLVASTSPNAFAIQDQFKDLNYLTFSTATTTARYNLFDFRSATSTGPIFAMDNNGHLVASSTTPVLSSCGTTPSLSSDSSDLSGTITVGSVAATACTLSFGVPHVTGTHCVISNQSMSVVNAGTYSESLTGFTFSQTGLTSDKLDYICIGQ